jgi:hypothetical protein
MLLKMKTAKNNPLNSVEEFFNFSINSSSGCNIKVEDKIYNIFKDSKNDLNIKEIGVDFILTIEEFNKLKK